jgi:hypothetical protein
MPQLIELLFQNPYMTVRRLERATGLTNQGARNLIRKAEVRGWVETIGAHGRGGREFASGGLGVRVPVSPHEIRLGQRLFPFDGKGLFHVPGMTAD